MEEREKLLEGCLRHLYMACRFGEPLSRELILQHTEDVLGIDPASRKLTANLWEAKEIEFN